MTTHDVTVDGLKLRVTETGRGPALLLVHGLSASHGNWEYTMPAFADRWRVIAVDLPGHGESDKPDAPYTLDFHAGILRSLGRALDVDEAVVVGNSLGGQIALELALTYPDFVRGLVLVAPAGGFGTAVRPLGWVLEPLAAPGLLRRLMPFTLRRSFFEPSGPGFLARERALTQRLTGDDFPAYARAVTRSLAGALRADPHRLEDLVQPLLVIWGRDDRMVPLAQSRRFVDRVPHARLEVFDRCGHVPMLECPAEFNRTLAEFLRAVEAAPRRRARAAGGA